METLSELGARLVERTRMGASMDGCQLADPLCRIDATDERTIPTQPIRFDRYSRRRAGDSLWMRGVRTTGALGQELPGR